jgi:hypothetical protein
MNRVDSTLPIFLHQGLKSYPIDWMKTQVLAAHHKADYNTGNNFQINDSSGVFHTLYKDFFHIANQHFGPLELDQRNLASCWGYVTNKFFYKGGIHNHLNTCVINAVYYLNIPETADRHQGSLSFYDNNFHEIYNIRPNVGDLIIFPGYLNHQPHQSFSLDYRVSINMEIICQNVWGVDNNSVLS